MNAVVIGNGSSGKAAAELLRRRGWRVVVLEGADAWPEGAWDLCVTSPGVPVGHRWQNAARLNGVRVISELQLGAEHYRALGGRMLAVTGSKGKSSVVKLVAEALNGIPCGNYGKPLCEVVLDFMGTDPSELKGQTLQIDGVEPVNVAYNYKLPIAVVEISSFQLETTELPMGTFDAAAILNLQEDHLDRHGTVEKYHDLKRKLLNFTAVKIVGTDPQIIVGTDPWKIDGAECGLLAGSYFDNPILRVNGLCAVALLKAVGLSDDLIRKAFARFEPLPHRMQTVGIYNGVSWIDDSKATSISALIAGVTMAYSRIGSVPRVRLIAGGLAKGDDPADARECLAEVVAKVYLIGKCATIFSEAWKDVVPCELCGTLEAAVAKAANDSREGDCVLLSPGTASFDQFKSYGERGDCFAALAHSLER